MGTLCSYRLLFFIPQVIFLKKTFIQQINGNCGIKLGSAALAEKFSQKSSHGSGAVLSKRLDYGTFGGLTQNKKRRCYD